MPGFDMRQWARIKPRCSSVEKQEKRTKRQSKSPMAFEKKTVSVSKHQGSEDAESLVPPLVPA
jgi:hypothetical protein